MLCRQGGGQGLSGPDRDLADPGRDAQGQRRRQEVAHEVLALGQERRKPQPNPAASAIIAKHRTGEGAIEQDEITDRLFLPMLLEATRVLEEGIVREPGDVDMGLILGIGFPPFRGGILRWCDSGRRRRDRRKTGEVLAPLGKRFEPTETLLRAGEDAARRFIPPQDGHRLK